MDTLHQFFLVASKKCCPVIPFCAGKRIDPHGNSSLYPIAPSEQRVSTATVHPTITSTQQRPYHQLHKNLKKNRAHLHWQILMAINRVRAQTYIHTHTLDIVIALRFCGHQTTSEVHYSNQLQVVVGWYVRSARGWYQSALGSNRKLPINYNEVVVLKSFRLIGGEYVLDRYWNWLLFLVSIHCTMGQNETL